MDRRNFLKSSLLSAAALSAPAALVAQAAPRGRAAPRAQAPGLVDTNVNLFDWPYRKLKFGDTKSLVAKLKKHNVQQAWAGSFEALTHKDMDGVNARLAEECRRHGDGMLLPFGSVNPAWPDWEEDLRRCHEVHGMPGVRLYAGYQTFDFGSSDFARLLQQTSERGLILQVALEMEDSRVHHPTLALGAVNTAPLLDLVRQTPRAKVQFLHWARHFRGPLLNGLAALPGVTFDISNIEGNGGVGRLINGNHWSNLGQVPAERFVFGSHAPFFPMENAILKLIESPLTAAQLHGMIQGNARALLPRARA